MLLEATLAVLALLLALAARPWRMLASQRPLAHQAHGAPAALWTPLLATLAILPWAWALPTLHHMPLQLQWSGACLVLLMLGWPLAVPTLLAVGALACLFSPSLGWPEALGLAVWSGIAPATLALLLGALVRRLMGDHRLGGARVFVYVLGRGFIGTALCMFAAGSLAQWTGHVLPGVGDGLSLVARWLMAWGDAFVTGMLSAVFVAFKPQWLATWSDDLYLPRPRP
ncbi:Uncharacterized membrane protein [Oryzisolibacter propanilivorax]|uniref:Uncharacterized membrane protein n=1 Tax=Oryzisolibacter propanilivorax TaxID=1527607 RepID=A0A1G9PH55_9BURK|nr:hypothetical protein [Oryzisolibacter propanilivorax]SDL97547.1 Uncharacterized membrane protein [Oryzisolibacter propanilivorax]